MTSSTFSLYARCLSESRGDPSESTVAVPHGLDTPIFSAAKASFISALTAMFENKVLYASPAGSRCLLKTPKDFYMPNYEDVELTTADGKTIHCWLIKRSRDSSHHHHNNNNNNNNSSHHNHQGARAFPTLIHLHGNACHIGHMLYDCLGIFQKVKSNILLVDYRGYGLSEGSPSQEGLLLDAEAALSYLLQRKDVVNPNKIFVFGRSLGGAVAIALAQKHQHRIQGIIVENTFTSMDELVSQLSPAFSPAITRMTVNKWNSAEAISQIYKPILFLSGRADEIVPSSMMTKLYRCAINSEGKELAAFPKGKHNSTCLSRGYYETIKRFVDRILTENSEKMTSSLAASSANYRGQLESRNANNNNNFNGNNNNNDNNNGERENERGGGGGGKRFTDSFLAASSLTLQ